MSETTFPDELVERCGKEVLAAHQRSTTTRLSSEIARAVLRESGHAELVAALKEARERAQATFDNFSDEDSPPDPLIVKIDAALRKAGALK